MAASDQDTIHALNQLLSSTLALLSRFSTSLQASGTPGLAPSDDSLNPLLILRDSASLLKAHTTKLSLLAINKPFTPTAISKVLREVSGTCLPAMISAVQICDQAHQVWGRLMVKEVRNRVGKVFAEMHMLLTELSSVANNTERASARRDSLSSTGVVWEACDALIQLEKLGMSGVMVKLAEQFRDTIKDAITELQEWREGADLETEGHSDHLLDSDDEAVDGDGDSFDDIFNAPNSMPKDRPQLRELVEQAEGRLKKVILLYAAIIKRRLKTFRSSTDVGRQESSVDTLDRAMTLLDDTTHRVDDLAACFYDLDEDSAQEALESSVAKAREAASVVRLDWAQKEDEFTVWIQKWEEAIK